MRNSLKSHDWSWNSWHQSVFLWSQSNCPILSRPQALVVKRIVEDLQTANCVFREMHGKKEVSILYMYKMHIMSTYSSWIFKYKHIITYTYVHSSQVLSQWMTSKFSKQLGRKPELEEEFDELQRGIVNVPALLLDAPVTVSGPVWSFTCRFQSLPQSACW